VNKIDLIASVAEASDISRAKAGEVVDAVFNTITDAMRRKDEVRLVGFGTFSTATRKATTGRNPRTGEEIKIPEATTVKFKVGKTLKDAVG
jgi:DNA-binding protein HU-beta